MMKELGIRHSLFAVLDHEVKAVEDVGLGGAAVEVEEEQVELRIDLLEPLFHAFGDDVVGDAAEGLQADHILDAVFGQMADFAGQEPPFAEVAGEVHHLFGQAGILKHIRQGTVERERLANVVELLYSFI